jgi:uncharacterized protein affecting Mg2+/Co2+ transport
VSFIPRLWAIREHRGRLREVVGLVGEPIDVTPGHTEQLGDLCSVEEVVGHQTGGRGRIMNG